MSSVHVSVIKNPRVDDMILDDVIATNTKKNKLLSALEISALSKYFNEISSKITQDWNSDNLTFGDKAWINNFVAGNKEQCHNHDNINFDGTHVLVQILSTGNAKEVLHIYDNDKKLDKIVEMTKGDILIFTRETYHGLENTNDTLNTLGFAVTIK